jgi:hypothetical protein
MELAVVVALVLFGYMMYASSKLPSDFSSQVVVNPRKNVDPGKSQVKKQAAPAPQPAAEPVAKEEEPSEAKPEEPVEAASESASAEHAQEPQENV